MEGYKNMKVTDNETKSRSTRLWASTIAVLTTTTTTTAANSNNNNNNDKQSPDLYH